LLGLQAPTSKRARGIYSIQNLTLVKKMTYAHAIESLRGDIHSSRPVLRPLLLHILPKSLQTAPKSTFIPKSLSPWKLRHLKSFRSNLQPRRLYRFRVICSLRLSISLQKFSATTTEMSACSYTSLFSPAFKMCNAP